MERMTESLQADWQAFLAFSPRLLYAVVVLVLFIIAGMILGRLLARVLHRTPRFRPNERFVRLIVQWSLVIAGILLALGIMGFKGVAASLLATGGVAAVVLGFAFREIGENLLAGLFLSFSSPFRKGDLIMTGDITGTVRAIDVRSVHIRTADACDVFVPSAQIFRQPLYNYTRDGLRRFGLRIGVDYQDDPKTVLRLLEEAARSVDGVLDDPRVVVTLGSFTASYVEYELFFHMDATGRRGIVEVTNDVRAACWRALKDGGMTFSSDVSTALDIRSVPALSIDGSPT